LLRSRELQLLRQLSDDLDAPPAPLPTTGDERDRLERLLEQLADAAAAARDSPLNAPARELFHDLDERLRLDLRTLPAGMDPVAREALMANLEDEGEPLLGFKGVAPGPAASDERRVISVECYDRGVVVRWEVRQAIAPDLRGASEGEIEEHFRERRGEIDPFPALTMTSVPRTSPAPVAEAAAWRTSTGSRLRLRPTRRLHERGFHVHWHAIRDEDLDPFEDVLEGAWCPTT
jgi:hypothetical protein